MVEIGFSIMRQDEISFHDAEIYGIEIDRASNRVVITLINADACRIILECMGVISFRGTDVILQNTVSRFLKSSSGMMSAHEVARWVVWASSLSDGSAFLKPEQIQAYVDRILNNEILLLVFEPSWGAEMAIVCERLAVSA